MNLIIKNSEMVKVVLRDGSKYMKIGNIKEMERINGVIDS
jgi:hypothetical protein